MTSPDPEVREGVKKMSTAESEHKTEQSQAGVSGSHGRDTSLGGLPFGIIDPVYASFYTVARLVCWSYGYSLCLHGSFTLDLDVLAVPWIDNAVTPEKLIHQIEYRTEWSPVRPNASMHSHGRMVFTLSSKEFNCPRFVDFGIMPRLVSVAESSS